MVMTLGRRVRVDFSSADASSAAPLTLFDDDNFAVLLQDNERVVIHNLVIYAEALEEGEQVVTVFTDNDDDNTVDSGERMVVVGAGTHDMGFGPEGMYGALGIVPHVIAGSSGQVNITGTAYIVVGATEGRPSWKESE